MRSTTPCIHDSSQRLAPVRVSNRVSRELLILIVEDDSGIRRCIRSILKIESEATVIEASDPYAALSLERAAGRPIDLLISDIDLKATHTGVELARELASRNPSLQVILISGFDAPPCDIDVTWRLLAKPIRIADFLNAVNESCAFLQRAKLQAKVTTIVA